MFLDAAEDRAERHVLLSMRDCEELLDGFLKFNGRDVLEGHGSRTKKTADSIARERFREFSKCQDATSKNDFEKQLGKLTGHERS